MEETVINGVKVIKDGEVTHFVPVEEDKKQECVKEEEKGFFGRLWSLVKSGIVRPYIKIRDLADPFDDRDDCDKGCDGKNCIEGGIKISF